MSQDELNEAVQVYNDFELKNKVLTDWDTNDVELWVKFLGKKFYVHYNVLTNIDGKTLYVIYVCFVE